MNNEEIKSRYVAELPFSDVIFKTNILDHRSAIDENVEYINPSIKTWFYCNVDTQAAMPWIDSGGFPLRAVHSYNMFNEHTYGKGVYIVKAFTIRPEMKSHINSLVYTVQNNRMMLPKSEVASLLKYLEEVASGNNYGRRITVRFVYFIPMSSIIKYKVVSCNGHRISLSIEDLYRDIVAKEVTPIANSTHEEKGLTLVIKAKSKNNNRLRVNILDKEVSIPTVHTTDSCHLDTTMFYNGKRVHSEKVYKDELSLTGLFAKTRTESDLLKDYAEHQLQIANVVNTKIKAINDWRKYLIDQEISLHKLNAYVVNQATAEIKLEKEEISAFKDGINLLKTLIP